VVLVDVKTHWKEANSLKVLVTGGAGFIGSHIIEELVKENFQVASVDNYVTGFSENLTRDVTVYEIDINNPDLEMVFEIEKPDYVIHLAAQVSVTKSMKDPSLDFFTNTVGTVNILHLSKKHNVKKFLFASSAAVYGEPEYLPIDENHLIHTKSFYALSKLSAENYIKQYSLFHNLDSCIFRFSNVYGPRQNANGEAGVIAIFIDGVLTNEKVNLFGGDQTRDFIYVKDIAKACLLALTGQAVGVFNISSCTETKIADLFHQIADVSGIYSCPIYLPERNSDIQKSVLDNRKACRELNWQPQYQLTEGLSETIKYYSNLLSLKFQEL